MRLETGLSQAAFAKRYDISPGALRDWEQGRRTPDRYARMFLTILDREPEAVKRALGE